MLRQNIPKIIHQIWLEPTPPPYQWLNEWREKHPTWEYHLWTNENLPNLYNQKQFDFIDNSNEKTHILCYEVLHQFGGIYLDAHMEYVCALDDDLLNHHFFSCYENEFIRPGLIGCRAIGSSKGHPLLSEIINTLHFLKDALGETGSFFFTKMIGQYQATHQKVAILPSHFFYPEHYTGYQYQGHEKVYGRLHWQPKKVPDHNDSIELNTHAKELAIIKDLLPENPIVLEAGAHYGEDTIILSKMWPKGKILAFEPYPVAFEELKKHVKNQTNVRIFPYGLFSKTTEISFWVNPKGDGASSILEDNRLPETIDYYTGSYQISIFCMNLDEWAQKEGVTHFDYMWLDLEGVELQVLSSAPNILKTVQVISAEVNFLRFRKETTLFSELDSFLTNQGFVLYKLLSTPGLQATAIYVRKT